MLHDRGRGLRRGPCGVLETDGMRKNISARGGDSGGDKRLVISRGIKSIRNILRTIGARLLIIGEEEYTYKIRGKTKSL